MKSIMNTIMKRLVRTGTMEWIMTFPSLIGNFIIPTDFHSIIFQKGRAKKHQHEISMKNALTPVRGDAAEPSQ